MLKILLLNLIFILSLSYYNNAYATQAGILCPKSTGGNITGITGDTKKNTCSGFHDYGTKSQLQFCAYYNDGKKVIVGANKNGTCPVGFSLNKHCTNVCTKGDNIQDISRYCPPQKNKPSCSCKDSTFNTKNTVDKILKYFIFNPVKNFAIPTQKYLDYIAAINPKVSDFVSDKNPLKWNDNAILNVNEVCGPSFCGCYKESLLTDKGKKGKSGITWNDEYKKAAMLLDRFCAAHTGYYIGNINNAPTFGPGGASSTKYCKHKDLSANICACGADIKCKLWPVANRNADGTLADFYDIRMDYNCVKNLNGCGVNVICQGSESGL